MKGFWYEKVPVKTNFADIKATITAPSIKNFQENRNYKRGETIAI